MEKAMQLKVGTKTIRNGCVRAIAEISIENYTLYVFPGTLSKNDFLIKYSKEGTRIRTPKHIHWVTDILMKMQGNSKLCKSFLKRMNELWKETFPLDDNSYDSIESIVMAYGYPEYDALNQYGEYSIEFLFVLMKLLMVQEKTNRPDAYMFGSIMNQLLEEPLDIFKVVSTAGFGGRR